jgi:hypothetical protein
VGHWSAGTGRDDQSFVCLGLLFGGGLRLENRLDRGPQLRRSQAAGRASQPDDTDGNEEGSPVTAIARHRTAPVSSARSPRRLGEPAECGRGKECVLGRSTSKDDDRRTQPAPTGRRRLDRGSYCRRGLRPPTMGRTSVSRPRRERRDHLPQLGEIDKLKKAVGLHGCLHPQRNGPEFAN